MTLYGTDCLQGISESRRTQDKCTFSLKTSGNNTLENAQLCNDEYRGDTDEISYSASTSEDETQQPVLIQTPLNIPHDNDMTVIVLGGRWWLQEVSSQI